MVAYAGAQAATSLASAVASLVARLLVPPAVFGAQSLVAAGFKYVAAFNGQFRNAIDREVPLQLSRGDAAAARVLSQHAYTLLIGACVLEAAGFLIVALLATDLWIRYAATAYAVVTFTSSLAAADIIFLKVHRRLQVISRRLLLSAILQLVVVISLSWAGGGRGFLSGLALGSVGLFLLVRSAHDLSLRELWRSRLNAAVTRHVARVGGMFSLFNVSRQMLGTLDRFFVAAWLSLTSLGIYSLGSTIVQFIHVVPASLAGAYFPTVIGHVTGPGEDGASARASLRRAHAGTCLVSVVAGLPVIVLLPVLLEAVLPSYAPDTVALQIMSVGGVIYAAQSVPIQIMAARAAFGRGLILTLVTAAAAVPGYALVTADGLVAVALVTAVAYAVYGIGLVMTTNEVVPARLLLPWTALSIVLPAAPVLLSARGHHPIATTVATGAMMVAFVLLRSEVGITFRDVIGHLWSVVRRVR